MHSIKRALGSVALVGSLFVAGVGCSSSGSKASFCDQAKKSDVSDVQPSDGKKFTDLIDKLQSSAPSEIKGDLKTLETISPEKNKQDLQQYSLQAYKLLQDARSVTTLAKVRSYDEDAHGVQNSVDKETGTIRQQAAQLRDIQKLVDKYASK